MLPVLDYLLLCCVDFENKISIYKLSLNVSKTNYMLFSNSAKDTNLPNLNISNQIIKNTKCTKFVGLHIDENLK